MPCAAAPETVQILPAPLPSPRPDVPNGPRFADRRVGLAPSSIVAGTLQRYVPHSASIRVRTFFAPSPRTSAPRRAWRESRARRRLASSFEPFAIRSVYSLVRHRESRAPCRAPRYGSGAALRRHLPSTSDALPRRRIKWTSASKTGSPDRFGGRAGKKFPQL